MHDYYEESGPSGLEQLERERGRVERRLERLEERIARVAARPEEPEADEDGCAVVWFKLSLPHGGPTGPRRDYNYAAVLTPKGWYVTAGGARSGGPFTWHGLLDWVEARDVDAVIWRATEWEDL